MFTVEMVDARTGESLVRVSGLPTLPSPGDVVAGVVVGAGPRTFATGEAPGASGGQSDAVAYAGVVRMPGRLPAAGPQAVRESVPVLLSAWFDAFGDTHVTLQTVLAHAGVDAELRRALPSLFDARGRVNARALGACLGSIVGVSLGGLTLRRAAQRWGNRTVWHVTRTDV